MRNLLAFLAAVLIAFLGLGWYLGWYSFQRVPTMTGHAGYNVDINSTKIRQDLAKGVQQGEEKLQEVLDKNKTDAKTPDKPALDPGKATDKSKPTSLLDDAKRLQEMVTPHATVPDR
jgi:hypothetical protein